MSRADPGEEERRGLEIEGDVVDLADDEQRDPFADRTPSRRTIDYIVAETRPRDDSGRRAGRLRNSSGGSEER